MRRFLSAGCRFLDEVFPNDPQSIAELQKLFGYVLLPDTRLQKFFLLIGKRRSGKGTVARILSALIGTHNVAGTTLNTLAGNFGLEGLLDKLLWTVSDMRLSRHTDQRVILERILSIVGEDIIDVPRKYKTPWTGRLLARLVIMTNQPPRIIDPSGAFMARMVPLVFNVSFEGREDPNLEQELLAELSGILNWALEGYLLLQEQGRFVVPESSAEFIRHITRSTNPLKGFLDDCCMVGPDKVVMCDALFDAWTVYREDLGLAAYSNKQSFGELCCARGCPIWCTVRNKSGGTASGTIMV